MEKVKKFDADYLIDYENGAIPLGALPIGAKVVDFSWEWEFRTGNNYSGNGVVKPVVWIVVAKDHYDGLEPHVTLLAEELIGRHLFDNSTDRDHKYAEYGYNHWGESGDSNATRGLRPWLNSTGIHSGDGFYQAFSENFKGAVPATTLPNKEWKNGYAYSTQDYVFIPSATELGDSAYKYTYCIGTAYPYFDSVGNTKLVARIDGDIWWYWTRSPNSRGGSAVLSVYDAGEFCVSAAENGGAYGVRPALNLKSGVLVSEIKD